MDLFPHPDPRSPSREAEFVDESQALARLEGVVLVPAERHAQVLAEVLESGARKQPLALEAVVAWQRALGLGGMGAAPGRGTDEWIASVRRGIDGLSRFPDATEFAPILGDGVQGFLSLSGPSGGLTARLTAAWLCARVGAPFVIVRAAEREAWTAAARHPMAMRAFFADKLREAVFDLQGRLMLRVLSTPFSDRYLGVGPGELIVEWHALVKKREAWRELALRG